MPTALCSLQVVKVFSKSLNALKLLWARPFFSEDAIVKFRYSKRESLTLKRWQITLLSVWERNNWVLPLPIPPAALPVATAWSRSCTYPSGEWSVCRGKGSAKGKSTIFPPNFFSWPSSAIMPVTFSFRERSVLGTNSAYFLPPGSFPHSSTLHPVSGAVTHCLHAYGNYQTPCLYTALPATEYSSDFKRRPTTNPLGFPVRVSPL